MPAVVPRPRQIAPGVYWARLGRWVTETNVYLVRSDAGWVLIDTAWAGHVPLVRVAAETLFGVGGRPTAILLTHIHPDHSGAAPKLARAWRVPVYVHPEELRFASGQYLPEYANPLDRWLLGPALRLVPRSRLAAMRAGTSLEGMAQAFTPDHGVPGLPGWGCVPTPGHTPGHVAFLRAADGILVTGDAALTVELNSLPRFHRHTPELSAPPRYTTWDWSRATASVTRLAARRPTVLAPGHGHPVRVSGGRELTQLAERMSRCRTAGVPGP